MAAKTDTNAPKPRTPAAESTVPPVLAVEDDERHAAQVDDYIVRNRDALNASIKRSRAEVAEGKVSTKSIDDLIADGRRRHARRP
jgi:hypothetical protein